ncbi:MAG TPA: beta-N-acetylhexosaminidase [Bacillaceae bacterium]|nr:beta-N-acetylhexosaminidase [Bacillaceae bacterium]
MKKVIITLLLLNLIAASVLIFVNMKNSSQESDSNGKSEDSNQQKDSVIDNMSLEEKVGQMIFAGIDDTVLNENTKTLISKYNVGGLIFYGDNLQNPEQSVELLNDVKTTNLDNRFPLFLGIDQEGGRVTRLPGNIVEMPTNQQIGEIGNERFSYDFGELLGQQLNAFGFNMNFAPVLDVNSNPNNPVIGDRSFGNNVDIVSKLGIQTMKGIEAQHVIPVVKHFPGHGDTSVDSHLELPIVDKTREEINELEIIPFQKAINEGTDVVMVAHILLPKIDPTYPSSMSTPIISGILREELQFNGVVMTDDMTMNAIMDHYGIGEAIVESVKAGSDIVLIAHDFSKVITAIDALVSAVESGEISESRINESVERIIKLKQKYKLKDTTVDNVDIDILNQTINGVLEKYMNE